MVFQIQGVHHGLVDGSTGLVGFVLEEGAHFQARRRGRAPQIRQQRVPRAQGLARPVQADRAECSGRSFPPLEVRRTSIG